MRTRRSGGTRGIFELLQERGRTIDYRCARNAIESRRFANLSLNLGVEIRSSHRGPIRWLDIDPVEHRYVLSGGASGRLALYDVDVGSNSRQDANAAAISPIFVSPGGSSGASGISSLQWYPVDTGLFISSALDGSVKAWDTNNATVAAQFDFDSPIYSASMSPCGQHTLIAAAGLQDNSIRLCDLNSGSSTHMLIGHTGPVWSTAWSPIDEYILVSGSADCSLSLWDVRRSGRSARLFSFDPDIGLGNSICTTSNRQRHQSRNPYNGVPSAHSGIVNSLTFTSDGHFLLSSATDGRLRCWDVERGCHTFMNYIGTENRRRMPFRIATHCDCIFFPNDDDSGAVLSFKVHSLDGMPFSSLRGHMGPANCCVCSSQSQELITGGEDGMLLLWTPTKRLPTDTFGQAAVEEKDEWSDEEPVGSNEERNQTFIPPILNGGRGTS